MNNYNIIFTNGTSKVIQAACFSAQGSTLTFYRYDGSNDPEMGVYANTVYTHMFKMDDIQCVELVDEPVTI